MKSKPVAATGKRSGTHGLTQLELMVSLAIMGMIAVLLANSLNFNRLALERVAGNSVQTDYVIAQDSLRNWIEDMPLRYGNENAVAFFSGSSASLRFRSIISDGSFWPGAPAEVILTLTDGAFMATGSGTSPDQTARSTIVLHLAAEIEDVSVSYFGRQSEDSSKGWHVDWADPKFLPDLVKIEWRRTDRKPAAPLTLQPAKVERQREMSLSSLLPPG